MVLQTNELFSTASQVANLRVDPRTIQVKEFAAGSGTLAKLTPVAFNTSTNKWQLWASAQTNEVNTVTANATPATAGTWTMTVNGQTATGIVFDVTAAALQTALEALSTVNVGDVTCVATTGANLGIASAVITVTMHGDLAGQDVDVSAAMGGLTGNVHVLAEATKGASGSSEVTTITSDATPATAGDFTLTVEGETTAAITWEATAALVEAALILLSNVSDEDLTVEQTTGTDLGDASAVITISWHGRYVGKAIAVSYIDNTTGNDHVLAEATAGAALNDTNVIRGFVWPDAVVLEAAAEVLGHVLLRGDVHFDDIPVTSNETAITLKEGLRAGMRSQGLMIQGLDQVR